MKKKLLITGASGFLGYHLLRTAAKEWEVHGLVHSGSFNYENAVAVKCDIADYISIGNIFDDIEPDAVIHAAALADANFCQNNQELAYSVNVEASKNLAGICSDFQIPFVFTSTDLVFDGKKGMYKEGDGKNPLSIYAEHKAKAEDEIMDIYPESVIFRLSLMFGYAAAGTHNFTQKVIDQIKRGEVVHLFNDEFRSVCGAASISKGILELMRNESGIIHLAGKERLSRFEFGLKVLRAYGLSDECVKECSQKEMVMSAPRPADVSLNISKAQALGFSPLLADEELRMISTQHNLLNG
jgi:dTDP-4-dehydrorhamnose reductase